MNRYYKYALNSFGIAISFIGMLVGTLVGLLFSFGFIPSIMTITWIIFGIDALLLTLLAEEALFTLISPSASLLRCLDEGAPYLLAGINGTLVFSLAALSIPLVPGSVIAGIFVGLETMFFTQAVLTYETMLFRMLRRAAHCAKD